MIGAARLTSVTIALCGLPGSPTSQAGPGPTVAASIGCPGRTATLSTSTVPALAAMAACRWSTGPGCGPTGGQHQVGGAAPPGRSPPRGRPTCPRSARLPPPRPPSAPTRPAPAARVSRAPCPARAPRRWPARRRTAPGPPGAAGITAKVSWPDAAASPSSAGLSTVPCPAEYLTGRTLLPCRTDVGPAVRCWRGQELRAVLVAHRSVLAADHGLRGGGHDATGGDHHGLPVAHGRRAPDDQPATRRRWSRARDPAPPSRPSRRCRTRAGPCVRPGPRPARARHTRPAPGARPAAASPPRPTPRAPRPSGARAASSDRLHVRHRAGVPVARPLALGLPSTAGQAG